MAVGKKTVQNHTGIVEKKNKEKLDINKTSSQLLPPPKSMLKAQVKYLRKLAQDNQ